MAQADLLVELLKNASSGDQLNFRKTAENLVEDERRKGHRLLAERMTKALRPRNVNGGVSGKNRGQEANNNQKDLFYETIPERSLDTLLLPSGVEAQFREFVEEQHRSELLHSYNLKARNRVLLAGPPGNGKTTLAEALAFELMYPLIVVRYETLVGSYLGETSTRLKNLLEYIRTQRCVLFFDEFETLGKERGDTNETGEIKRVVSSLLLQIDNLPDYVVVVAASNHPELLDKAVWRRFQLRFELPNPSRKQLAHHISYLSERYGVEFGYTPQTLAKYLYGYNFAEVEEFCLGIARRAVLDNEANNAQRITRQKLEQWRNRLSPVSGGVLSGD